MPQANGSEEQFAGEENVASPNVAKDAKSNKGIRTVFYRITCGTLCFGALVGAGVVQSVPPVAAKWRGKPEGEFLEYWRTRRARVEQVAMDGRSVDGTVVE